MWKIHINLRITVTWKLFLKLTDSLASNFVDSGGACNLQMESHEDAEISTNTSIAETDTLQTEQKGMHTLKHTCEHNFFYLY